MLLSKYKGAQDNISQTFHTVPAFWFLPLLNPNTTTTLETSFRFYMCLMRNKFLCSFSFNNINHVYYQPYLFDIQDYDNTPCKIQSVGNREASPCEFWYYTNAQSLNSYHHIRSVEIIVLNV